MKKIFANYCHSDLVSESLKHKTLKQFQHNRKLTAFTLAEVLITLTIIGVIAALTIPNLMQKWADHADVQKLKEAYSILNNAYKMAIYENGSPDNWGYANNHNAIIEKMLPYLKVLKYCGNSNGCAPSNQNLKWQGAHPMYMSLSGETGKYATWTELHWNGKTILQNGMQIATYEFGGIKPSGDAEREANLRVDINGNKGPNRYGYDVFFFTTNKNSLDWAWATGSQYCLRINGNYEWQGKSCGYWVFKHGNMDYKYRDVSAEW